MNETRGLWRGKRVDNGEWVEGDLSRMGEQLFIAGKDHWKFAVDSETLGECTGLKDKNGKLIFEGDIVSWCYKNGVLSGGYIYYFGGYKYGDELIVRRLESGFMLCRKNDGMPDIPNANWKIDNYAFWNYHMFLEIVGNIHDNPELLKGENDAP